MHQLSTLLPDGVARRAEVVRASSSSSVVRWVRRGDLVQLHPGVLVLPDRTGEWAVRAYAATLWADGPLSHLSALAAAGVTGPPPGTLHVTVPAARSPERVLDVLAHRTTRRLETVCYGRLEALPLTRSLVDAWAWAHSPARNPRAAAERPLVRRCLIEAVRSRGATVPALCRESDRRRGLAGRASLAAVLQLLAGGCESELEIWGVTAVLPGPPQIPAFVQQHRVTLPGGRVVRLDAAYPGALVAVELDGAAFHGSRDARERDLRRDTALATLGWVVLRFSYARLVADPAGCRREIAAVVRSRQAR